MVSRMGVCGVWTGVRGTGVFGQMDDDRVVEQIDTQVVGHMAGWAGGRTDGQSGFHFPHSIHLIQILLKPLNFVNLRRERERERSTWPP